jgi:uncharacterized protein
MIYREYGSSGEKVSVIGFGGMRFGERNEDPEYCAELIKAAYEGGINYFDTAPGYGKSEEIFGLALQDMLPDRNRQPFYVSTKTMKSDPGEARRELEQSLRRMGLDYVDFYHMWCICDMEDYRRRRDNGVLREFERMQDEGLVRHIVVSTHLPGDQVGELLADYPFEGVLLGYSAMNFKYRDAGVQAAHDNAQGVVVMNPLGGGIIPQHPELFDFLRTQPDESVVEAALRFLINDQRIDVVLNGFGQRAHLDEALAAVDGFQPIAAERIERMRAELGASFDQMCTTCRYCDNCPEGIAIPELMDAYNQYMLKKDEKAVGNRLRYHWQIDNAREMIARCTRCGQCEEACTQSLPIIERLQEIDAMLAD